MAGHLTHLTIGCACTTLQVLLTLLKEGSHRAAMHTQPQAMWLTENAVCASGTAGLLCDLGDAMQSQVWYVNQTELELL